MTHDPIEINGTTYAPVLVDCPECGVEIDAQRALYEGRCPECRTSARVLCADPGEGAAPPEDYEPESYQVQA